MNTPYIGVTDFTTKKQVDKVFEFIPPWVDRRLHVGAMCSYKTINSIPTSSGWENIWLDEKGLNTLFVKQDHVYNVIHYADYSNESGGAPLTKSKDVLEAIRRSGPGVDGIQLDMIWPSTHTLESIKHKYPDISIIVQVSSKALEIAYKQGLTMQDVLEAYTLVDTTDYFLIDFGMGRGTPFDPARALELVEEALQVVPQKQIAVAGGLGPDTYKNLEPIVKKYRDISCDAQGQLRDSGSAVDPLNLERVTKYITGVCSLL